MKATLIDQTKLPHITTAVPPFCGNFETHFIESAFILIIKQNRNVTLQNL